MKRTLVLAVSLAMTATLVHAETEAYDCFPGCNEVPAAGTAVDLCDIGAVREAVLVNERIKPVREIYDIAVNPTGFAIKMVDQHVVHIPRWVGIAMDPKGAARSYVVSYVRDAAKKQVGLQGDCKAPSA